MPLPHWLTRVNLAVTNRLTMPLASRLPWFGVLEHVGRRTGVLRRTPLNVFRSGPDRWVIALTYGPGVQWPRNIEAAGECRMLIQGRWLRLAEPRRFRDRSRATMPLPVRWVLTLLGVDQFVELRARPRPTDGVIGRFFSRAHTSRARDPRWRCGRAARAELRSEAALSRPDFAALAH